MSIINIPQEFQEAVEAAIEKNDTVLSKLTLSQIKEITGDTFENYQISFYFKEYRKQHKSVSKEKRLRQLEEENAKFSTLFQQIKGMIQSNTSLDLIREFLETA
jgi:hypothetical protein